MNKNEEASDGDLRSRADERGPPRGPGGRVENPRDPVCLGQQRPVDDGEPEPDAEPLQGAHERRRLGQQDERVDVADQDTAEEHVAQLPAWGLIGKQ